MTHALSRQRGEEKNTNLFVNNIQREERDREVIENNNKKNSFYGFFHDPPTTKKKLLRGDTVHIAQYLSGKICTPRNFLCWNFYNGKVNNERTSKKSEAYFGFFVFLFVSRGFGFWFFFLLSSLFKKKIETLVQTERGNNTFFRQKKEKLKKCKTSHQTCGRRHLAGY